LVKKGAALSLVCPQEKLLISEKRLEEPEEAPGEKRIEVDGVEFRLSVIAPKEKSEKEQPLPAKEFALYRAGVYDMTAIRELPWSDYRPFVLKLFGVREHGHQRYGLGLDGYIGTNSVLLWNYPDHRKLTLDYGYVDDLHRMLRGRPGERVYVIAPVVAMAFAEDEVVREETTYVFLKVPLSVLLRLIEKGAPAALKQPVKEDDVNEVIDAVGFDFISQPQVEWKARKERRKEGLLTHNEYVLEISEFRAQTLATDPEDFQNFETFSMAMLDLGYDGDVFRLGKVFWGEDVVNAAGGIEKAKSIELRIPEADFAGKQMMAILCDRYGNEKALCLKKAEFDKKRGNAE
jgi:site-specific DNA-methyltransferase (adenine-specific)/adenine-specific DNA-methyltransferase